MKLVFRETVHWRVRNSQHLQLTGRIATSSLRDMAAGIRRTKCMTIDAMSCVSTMSPSPTVRVGFWWLRAPLTTHKQLRQGTTGFAKTISRFSTENQQLNHSVAMTWHSSFHWPSQPPNFWLSSGPIPLIMNSASNWEPSVKNSVKHNIDLLALLESIHLCLLHYIISDIIWIVIKKSPQKTSGYS